MISPYDHPSNLEASELVTEETMINPNTPLPSFLEMSLIDSTFTSGQAALSSSIQALSQNLVETNTTNRNQNSTYSSEIIIAKIKHRIGILLSRYPLEIQALITYFLERHCLSSASGGGTLAESVYGSMRSKVIPIDNGAANSRNSLSGVPAKKKHLYHKKKKETSRSMSNQSSQNSKNVMKLLPMSEKDCIRSAFFMAFAPYLTSKLLKKYQQMKRYREDRENVPEIQDNQMYATSPMLRIKKKLQKTFNMTFFYLYPYLHMTQQGVCLYYQYSYLLGHSIYYSPNTAFLKLLVRRVTLSDRRQQSLASAADSANSFSSSPPSVATTSSTNNRSITNADGVVGNTSSSTTNNHSNANPSSINPKGKSAIHHHHHHPTANASHKSVDSVIAVARTTVIMTLTSLYLGACFMKLREEQKRIRRRYRMQSMQNTPPNHNPNIHQIRRQRFENGSHAQTDSHPSSYSIPLPPPPKPLPNQNHSGGTHRNSTVCPLCQDNFINPAVSTSGYVFCYRCLIQYIKDGDHLNVCPITGKYCREDQIIRIYESTPATINSL